MAAGVNYRERVVDGELAERLRAIGAVLIEGPKACGKTESASRQANTTYRLDVDDAARNAAGVAPALLLDNPRPVLLDEWQVVPSMWDHVRRGVDDLAPAKGLYILTGSATPNEDVSRHSGAGRIAVIQMRPMSLTESGHSTGQASLQSILAGDSVTAQDSGLTIPRSSTGSASAAGRPCSMSIVRTQADGCATISTRSSWSTSKDSASRRRDPENIRRLLNSLARNVGTAVRVTALGQGRRRGRWSCSARHDRRVPRFACAASD